MATLKGGYPAALDFIMRRELFGIKLGLDNISKFLNRIETPQNRFKSIHIAGTNGKGSTASALESILRRAGYKTGIFTSPHLADYRERIKVDGQQISKQFITEFVKKYKTLISRNKVTFFETCTALAFCYFAYKKVDFAVIEVGLGGRLDATNTLTPILSIITDISYDHTNILGDTLTKIAYEKSGIIKNKIPILAGIMKNEPHREIARISKEREAPLSYLGNDDFTKNGSPVDFDYHRNGFRLDRLKTALPGHHQIKNAALAVRAVEILNNDGLNISRSAIKNGLKNIHWPGRFQIVKKPGKPTMILDVCHNPSGVKAMVECFREMFPSKKTDLVMGFVRNKDLKKSVGYLEPIAKRVEIVQLKTHRSAEPEEIASFFKRKKFVNTSKSVNDSVRKLIETANSDDIIIVCGSHYAVGEFIPAINKIL